MSALGIVLAAQITAGAQLIPLVTHADPVPGGGKLTELRVVQPLLFAGLEALGGRLRVHAMLDFEGLTMPHGQLATGDFGEGFNDRRHPHTYAHELLVSAVDAVRLPAGVRWSVTAGKGFAPFGTDDPMNRPSLIFPVNHHWSQVLERAVLIGALRYGPVTLEGGLFNGDEPERPGQWPAWDRFGDSRSLRLTMAPARGLELQVSRARTESPEHRGGAGLDHSMWNASARVDRSLGGGSLLALVEWARTDEEGAFQLWSGLAEAQYTAGRHRPFIRIERTERPEDLRVNGNPFRSIRPHSENGNNGITRWVVVTVGYGRRLEAPGWPVRLEGIAEAGRARVTLVTGIPAVVYGRNDLWLASVGLRIAAGSPVHRMGRYGVAAAGEHHTMDTHEP